ncbi:phenylalanine--tRNA ligase subunit beta [Candidatus Woesearchaeota archaeon]|nr:phenylalanine--tRNA ligase subunit beta [Candidatus Woesearchaeota archaeon]
MPTINLNKNVFEKLVGKKLTLDKLKDRISMLGTDLESIEGNEIIVEVFPNRPDMLSEQGFARAFSSFIGVEKGLRNYTVKKNNKYVVKIEDAVKKVRPYTACAIVKGLKLDDEKINGIIQIQEKLHVSFGRNRKKLAIGIYPLEEIKLPITYTAKKPKSFKFLPLEGKKEMDGLQILSQHPTGREYGHLLENSSMFPLFIDSDGAILSMPPIINSEKTGKISGKTKDVFIECSGFELKELNQCLNIIVTALADMGGDIHEMELQYGKKKIITPDLSVVEKELDVDYINKILGLNLKEKKMGELLEKMGYGIKAKKVLIPAYRTDILHQIDLAEDVAIAYGYENFKAEIPNVATIGGEDNFEVFKSRVADILVGLGLIETMSYHLINEDVHNKKMCCDMDLVKLENPLTNDYSVLRAWIVPSLMQVLSENTNREYPQNIFEIGSVFKLDGKKETGVRESIRVGVVLCGSNVDFTSTKQVFDALMRALNVEYNMRETKHDSFIAGRVARVGVDGKNIAYVGEIKPEVLGEFEVNVPVVGFEINLSELFKLI